MAKIILIAALVLGSGSVVAAQEYDRVLIPLLVENPDGVPGANGSRWRTFFEVYNQSDEGVLVVSRPDFECRVGGCLFTAPPHSAFVPDLPAAASSNATFMYVQRVEDPAITATLRVQDLSRELETWGTEIPVVWPDDYLDGRFQLLNVPVTPDFRQTLRVYDDEGRNGTLVRVKVFDHESELFLGESLLTLTGALGAPDPYHPASVGVFAFHEAWPAISSAERLRIEIEPVEPGTRLWAFVSVTNNDTQHVTTITPQRQR